jgi:hypothetical protein
MANVEWQILHFRFAISHPPFSQNSGQGYPLPGVKICE